MPASVVGHAMLPARAGGAGDDEEDTTSSVSSGLPMHGPWALPVEGPEPPPTVREDTRHRRPRSRRRSPSILVRATAMEAPNCLLRLLSSSGPDTTEALQAWLQRAARPAELSSRQLAELQVWVRTRAREAIFAAAFEELAELRSRAAMLGGDMRRAVAYVARCERALRAAPAGPPVDVEAQ